MDSIRNHALFNQFTKLMAENEILAKQNRLFQSYLARYEQTAQQDEVPKNKTFKNYNKKKPQPKKLTLDQLMNIAMLEHEYRKGQLVDLEERVKSDISLLKAITEATRIRINEMRKEAYEFKRDIVLGGTNPRTGRIMAEKVTRYFEEKLKAKTALWMKIRTKNSSLRTQREKMKVQVKQKKEQGESLHSIDFHQLEIKNAQFNAKKQERNEDLRKLKRTTGKTVQTLNNAKRQLNNLLVESKGLQTSIRERKKATERLTAELKRVEAEVAKEKEKNKKFKIQQSNPDMPQVLDYVNQKSEMYDLQAAVRNWERKVEIIEMAARRARTTIRRISEQGYQVDENGNVTRATGGSSAGGFGATRRMNNSMGATSILPPIGARN